MMKRNDNIRYDTTWRVKTTQQEAPAKHLTGCMELF